MPEVTDSFLTGLNAKLTYIGMPQESKLNYCFRNLKSFVSVGEFARHFHCLQ